MHRQCNDNSLEGWVTVEDLVLSDEGVLDGDEYSPDEDCVEEYNSEEKELDITGAEDDFSACVESSGGLTGNELLEYVNENADEPHEWFSQPGGFLGFLGFVCSVEIADHFNTLTFFLSLALSSLQHNVTPPTKQVGHCEECYWKMLFIRIHKITTMLVRTMASTNLLRL